MEAVLRAGGVCLVGCRCRARDSDSSATRRRSGSWRRRSGAGTVNPRPTCHSPGDHGEGGRLRPRRFRIPTRSRRSGATGVFNAAALSRVLLQPGSGDDARWGQITAPTRCGAPMAVHPGGDISTANGTCPAADRSMLLWRTSDGGLRAGVQPGRQSSLSIGRLRESSCHTGVLRRLPSPEHYARYRRPAQPRPLERVM